MLQLHPEKAAGVKAKMAASPNIVEDVKGIYQRGGVELTNGEVMDEIAAEYTKELLENSSEFKKLVGKDRSVAQKLLDSLRSFIQKVKSVFKKSAKQDSAAKAAYGTDMATLENAAKLWGEALEATRNTVKKAGKSNKNSTASEKYSIKNTKKLSINEQFKMYSDGTLKSSDSFYFGEIQKEMQSFGFEKTPIVMNQNTYKKSQTKADHNVPRSVIKNIPNLLKTPIISFYKDGIAAVVVDANDRYDRKVVITLNGNATTDRVVSVTEITSIYGIMSPEIWIEHQISSKNVFVHNERKANEYLQNYGYNASLGNITRLSGEIVAQNSESVKKNSGQFQLKAVGVTMMCDKRIKR